MKDVLMRVAVAALLLVALVLPLSAADDWDIRQHLGTKTPYFSTVKASEDGPNATPAPSTCTAQPIHFNFLARHGSRLPDTDALKALKKLEVNISKHESFISDKYAWMKTWKVPYSSEFQGNLIPNGEREHFNLARRYLSIFNNTLGRLYHPQYYEFQTSAISRAAISGQSFAYGLFEYNGALGPDDSYAPIYSYSLPKNNDTILRFFDSCPLYQIQVDDNATANAQATLFSDSEHFKRMQMRIADEIGAGSNWQLTFDDVVNMYYACAYQISVDNITDQWCTLFNETDIALFEYYDDLQSYWINGYGYRINYEIACDLYSDFIAQFDALIANPKSTAIVKLRFAHAETVFPFLSLLGLYKDDFVLKHDSTPEQISSRKWRSNLLSPYAANIALLLYNCSGTYSVKLLHNEQEIQIPGCDDIYCPYKTFKILFSSYESCDTVNYCYPVVNPIEKDITKIEAGVAIAIGVSTFFVGLILAFLISYFLMRKRRTFGTYDRVPTS